MIFWDTSSLIRCYEPDEPGQAHAMNLLLRESGHKGSSLIRVEAVSVIIRRSSRRRAVRASLLALLEEHLSHFDLIPIDEQLMELAVKLVRAYSLRAGDALHLATAVRLTQDLGKRRFQFATADEEQADAAAAAGLQTIRLRG